MWIDRVKDMIYDHGSLLRVYADDRWGLSYVIDAFESDNRSIFVVELDEQDSSNSIRQGNRLSDAMYQGTGTRLFGLGVPVTYGLSLISKNRDYLSPCIFFIINAQFGNQLCEGLQALAGNGISVVEVYPESGEKHSDRADFDTVLSSEELRVRVHEAVDMFSTHLSENVISELVNETDGAYATLLGAVNRALSLPPPPRPTFGLTDELGTGSTYSPAILDYLVREKRWMVAFELAIRSSQFDTATAIIGPAGEAYFEAGLFTNFWDLIRQLPERVFDADMPAYWLLSAAITVNRQDEVKEFLAASLSQRPMPNLRALLACSYTSATSLDEAQRAFSVEKSVMTVRAMSHCLTSFGRPHEALKVALDNLSIVEPYATPRELANYSYTISRILLFLGRYSTALEWANWGLRIYEESRLKEELLKLSLLSAKAYYALLLGDPKVSRIALSSVSLDHDLAGIPSMDAVFSTAADLALVSGKYETALELYSVNHRESPREQLGYTVVDIVGALIMCGLLDDAVKVANECHSIANGTHERNAALARLAMGIANAHAGVGGAKDQLASAIRYFSNANDSVAIGRAAIQLAQIHWKANNRNKALQVLLDVREHIHDLGQTGWILLGLPTNESKILWEEFQGGGSHLRLSLLGDRTASYAGTETPLSLRNAEILALLAAESRGVTGEQLAIDLYGEIGSIGTLKSAISKLRQVVPISSRPYALDAHFEADHVVVQRLVRDGRIAEAIEAYGGPLLPESEAPGIERLREILSESVRQAVLATEDRAILHQYCTKFPDDLDVIERLHSELEPEDPRYAGVSAMLDRVRNEWGLNV